MLWNYFSFTISASFLEPLTTTDRPVLRDNITIEIPLFIDDHCRDPCSFLSGFFLLMAVLTVTFDIQATALLNYKPSEQSDKISVSMKDVSVNEEKGEEKVKREDDGQDEIRLDSEASGQKHKAEYDTEMILMQKGVKEKDYSEEKCNDEEAVMILKRAQEFNSFRENERCSVKDQYGFTLLKKLDFHLIIWPGVFLGGIQVAYMYNLTAMMKSFGLEEHSTVLLTINFLSCALTRIPVFIFIDKVPNKSLFLLIGAVSMSIAFILTISFGHSVVLFTIGIILSAFTNSCSWTSTAALLSELFGTKYFGYNYGWMTCGYGLFALALQTLTGYLYDLNIDTSVTHTCYGRQCFSIILIVCLCLSIISTLCSAIRVWKIKSGTTRT